MSRFREEYYATKAHRGWVKVQRADHTRDPGDKEASRIAAWDWERRTLRSQYFAAKAKTSAKGTFKKRLAWLEPGFG